MASNDSLYVGKVNHFFGLSCSFHPTLDALHLNIYYCFDIMMATDSDAAGTMPPKPYATDGLVVWQL